VIAIENVRLFTKLQQKNRALTAAHGQVTEALEQQTATSEILRAIAHAQTDVQPVFDTIVRVPRGCVMQPLRLCCTPAERCSTSQRTMAARPKPSRRPAHCFLGLWT
jgi:hypothetical protein